MATGLFFGKCEEITLRGNVDLKSIRSVVRRIRRGCRGKPGTRYVLNCSHVRDFCGYALAEIVNLRWELQWQGSDIYLACCSPSLKRSLAVPLFESLVAHLPESERVNYPLLERHWLD